MLVKLAFVMQRFKKYLKNFCHDQQRWEGDNFFILWGDTAVMTWSSWGVPPVPPTRENPARCHIACSMIPISCKFYLTLACWFYSLGSRVAAVSLKQSLVFLTSRFYVI